MVRGSRRPRAGERIGEPIPPSSVPSHSSCARPMRALGDRENGTPEQAREIVPRDHSRRLSAELARYNNELRARVPAAGTKIASGHGRFEAKAPARKKGRQMPQIRANWSTPRYGEARA